MPPVSLVVCVYQERELLQRLLQESAGCYDDLVVAHDGPDTMGVRKVIEDCGGHFFEGPRAYQQEPHWPNLWRQAAHDWILRLDVDEYPSQEMREWLQAFRQAPEPGTNVSGFTCIWPLWNGRMAVTQRWPGGRIFLFNKQRVRFFGMAETVPIPDSHYHPLKLVLQHEPRRSSYGIHNILFRKQAYHWRMVIAQSLLGPPTELPCWRWSAGDWPPIWEDIRRKPLRTAFRRLVLDPVRQARAMWQAEQRIIPTALLGTGAHQFMMAVTFFFFRWRHSRRLKLL